jgi:hypothetical protein
MLHINEEECGLSTYIERAEGRAGVFFHNNEAMTVKGGKPDTVRGTSNLELICILIMWLSLGTEI